MYPNQPQQPQEYPPQQPQGVAPPYPPQPTAGLESAQQPAQAPLQPQVSPWGQQQQTQLQQPVSPAYDNQPQLVPDGMASIDYLNQIASSQKSNKFTRKQVIILGGVLLLAFAVFTVFMITRGGGAQNITEMSQSLVTRTASLAEVAKESQKSIKNQSLSSANSAIAVQLTSANSSLSGAFGNIGVNTAKPDKKIVTAESNQELLEKLEDARLSGVFDRVYSREMSYQLQRTMLLINDIHARTKNAELKTQLEGAYDNLEPLQKQLSEFSDTTG